MPLTPCLLNTRPEPQASRFTAELRAIYGDTLQVITAPLMEVEFLRPDMPEGHFAALVLTSETGAAAVQRLKAAGARLPDLAFCVGDRTAEAAFQAGLEPVSAKGDARDLVRLIASRSEEPLLYLHGEDRAADLAQALAAEGDARRVVSLVAYRQRALGLNTAARAALAGGQRVILPLFSPRSARLFLTALAGEVPDTVSPVVISENTRLILPASLAARAELAERPDGQAMLAAIGRCFPPPSP